jgi:hypothetical protein
MCKVFHRTFEREGSPRCENPFPHLPLGFRPFRNFVLLRFGNFKEKNLQK